MAISLQVKYAAQAYLTGDVVASRAYGFQYKEGDCLREWLEAGRSGEDWKSTFAIIYISDCNDINHPSVSKLIEPYSDDPDAPYKRKFYIQMPADENDLHRISIREVGETIALLSEVEALTVERA
tara:strand:+ start:80 stop:454 length:375 start_codon:yes stop_codon:yes gene_type:complete